MKTARDEYLFLFEELIHHMNDLTELRDYPGSFSEFDAFLLLLQRRSINERITQLKYRLKTFV